MIEIAFAKDQIRRLSNLPFFPAEQATIKELVLALRAARNEKLARLAIDGFVESVGSESRCPTAADIRRAVYAAGERESPDYQLPPATRCSHCSDTGMRRKIVYRGEQKYDFAVPCDHGARP